MSSSSPDGAGRVRWLARLNRTNGSTSTMSVPPPATKRSIE